MTEKPDVTYKDIGGMDIQKQEVREAIELPLIQHHLYQQIGIDPPRGVLLYGPPGTGESLFVENETNMGGRGCEYISITFPVIIVCLTTHTIIHSLFLSIKFIYVGKTMMAKAVANATSATFISMVGSEFVQKYLGEGPRMVRDVFRLARENSPCVIFIDEIDAIATKRFDAQTGADREVQRILLELLNQMDGFDQTTNVKVIMATNRADTLDPALLRPGRLDRKIEFPHPDRRQKRMVFQAATSKMNLSDELDLEDYVNRSEKVSCADVASICAEAGLQAIRENRYVVLPKDFDKAYKRAVSNREKELLFYSI
jgi:26S proteasome regulatory subunit T3